MDYLIIALTSMAPIAELRGAIPLGVLTFGLPFWSTFFVCTIANIFAAICVYLAIPSAIKFAKKRIKFAHKFIDKFSRKKLAAHSRKFEIWGEFFLLLFIAIPIPGSGGWSGALLANLLKLNRRNSIFLITLGVILSGVIISVLTFGASEIWEHFRALPVI